MTKPPDMLKSALWYAKRGYYVHPLHNAIFDDAGNCTGCTCEAWKRTQPEYGPNYKCKQPGKCPRTNWTEKSTIEPATIRKWWGKPWCDGDVETGRQVWNYPNIGIDMGKSGKIAFDKDLYKANYAGDSIQVDIETVKVRTGRGGIHDWYVQPTGKAYGNATGTLPEGIDVRGAGGYVVAPPSLHWSGKRYEFVEGHSPADLDPAPLPQFLIDILEAAQTTPAEDVKFSRGTGNAPDLTQWPLYDATLQLILGGHPAGSDRSRVDQKVITALLVAGADNDDIRDIFAHFPIGEKYSERGDKYLGYSIGKARAWLADQPFEQPQPEVLPQLLALRTWGQSPEFTARLIEDSITQPAEYEKSFIALVNHAIAHRVPRVLLSCRQFAKLFCGSHMTGKRHLAMFGEGITTNHKDGTVTHRPGLKLVTVTDDPKGFGKWIDLTNLLRSVTPLNLSSSVRGCNTSQQFADEHLADEAFVPYQYRFAIKFHPNAEILRHGLSAVALLIAAILSQHGELTRETICRLTGLSKYTVGKMLRRMESMGLLVVWRGKPYRYELHPNFEEVLDDLRPMLPSWGIGQNGEWKALGARANFCDLQLENRTLDEVERAKIQARRNRYDRAQEVVLLSMIERGLDPFAKLLVRNQERTAQNEDLSMFTLEELAELDPDPTVIMPRSYGLRFDAKEEWASKYKDLYDLCNDLEGDDNAKLVQIMYLHGGENLSDVSGEDGQPSEWAKSKAYMRGEIETARSLAQRVRRLVDRVEDEDGDWLEPSEWTMPTMHFDGVAA